MAPSSGGTYLTPIPSRPVTVLEENANYSSNLVVNSSNNCSALISACTDGFLCVWSRSSGHCRCRRKLPPWVGSPSMVRTLPSKTRYVCIGCCFMDNVLLSDHNSVDSTEGSEGLLDKESQRRKPSKCTIVIVDTYSLNIVQTVFHGNLSIGPMKFMGVFSADNDKEKHSSFVADSFGRVQMVSISKGPHNEGEGLTNLQNDTSHIETSVWGDWLSDSHQIVSITAHGNIVAFLLKNGCMFKLLSHGTTIGEISFVDKLFHSEGLSTLDHVTGGMFLESGYVGNVLNTHEPREMVATGFIVWTNRGSAIIYRISYLDAIFRCELHCEIPATCYPVDVRLSICFLQLNHYLLRFESVCIQSEEPSMWKPHVTIWSLDHFNDHQQCRMIGEGGSFLDWFERSPLLNREVDGGQTKSASLHISTPSLKNVNHVNVDDVNYDYLNKGRTVSSSMVISENLHVPYAVVYGYLSGEIEVIQFDHFQGLYFHDGSPNHEQRSNVCKQHFSGHAGAILCLAAHQMVGNAKGWNFNQVLVSGSMDCTIRIWDLDTGDVIMVMHHHVDPVRQIILSPSSTKRPWCDCFLSVGEDSCIALVSLETLRVERMFTGHPSYPAKVVWDGVRGYIAGLCQTNSGMSDATDILYIWDVKTGARERVLRGTAAHSMFDHFCKSISMNSISGTLLNGNTSVSTLPLPINEGGKFSQSSSASGPPPSTLKVTGMTMSQTPSVKGDSAKPFSFGSSASWRNKHPIKCSCPFPGITTLSFDLAILVCSSQKHEPVEKDNIKQAYVKKQGTDKQSPHDKIVDNSDMGEILTDNTEEHDWIRSFEEYLLRFSLSFLHLWTVDCELDSLLITDMKLKRPENFMVASGMQGDKGSLTLTFPGLRCHA
ncbi:Transducin/WD40 repeat-like superfamily protein [Quillaja saponaria]|uniref:Transducin/WD40 repeat-like superfamily protein n=1 Tax=Quillaja saponaria TaxID=32244 RepID=A0AAD7PQ51_QUISA|nr:Transducin/WD40 repeat-like superfamily protein [Quillaja saponaria]